LSFNYLYLSVFLISLAAQLLHLLRAVGTNNPLIGQLIYSGVTVWIGITVFASYFNEYSYILKTLSSWFSLTLINIFFIKYLSNHINLSAIQRQFALFGNIALFITPLLPIDNDSKFRLVGLFGVIYTLVFFFYSERLYHVLKSENKGHGSLPFSLCGIALVHFMVFCDVVLTLSVGDYHTIWITATIILLFPSLSKGVNHLENLDVKLSISKPVALHATLLSITGVYLLGISGISYIVRSSSLEVSYASQFTLLVALVFPLIYLLASTKIRREIFVWVNKNFFSTQFNYRETWKHLNQQLSPDLYGAEAASRGLCVILASVKSEGGAYFRFENGGWHLSSQEGVSFNNCEDELFSLFNNLTSNGWVVDINDIQSKPKSYPFIDTNVDFMIEKDVKWVVPSVVNDEVIGMWIVLNGNNNYRLNWEVRDHLHLLSQQLESYLKTQDTRQKYEVNAQFAAFHQMSAFVIHDLKNIYAQLSMINKNAIKHLDNKEFVDDAFFSLTSMEKRLDKTLSQLAKKQRKTNNESDSNCFFISDFLNDFLANLINSSKDVSFSVTGSFEKSIEVSVNREKLNSVLTHLVDNAIQSCSTTKVKKVELLCENTNNHVIIAIKDTGCGMTREFVSHKLFKPFESTKGNSGMGLGAYDALEFIRGIGGTINVDSELNKGTVIKFNIPRNGVSI